MSETIETLLQENIGQAQQVDALASELSQDVGRLNSVMSGLAAEILDAGNSGNDALERLVEALEGVRPEFESERQAASIGIQELRAQAANATQLIDSRATELESVTGDVREVTDSLGESIDSLAAQVQAVVDEVNKRAIELASATSASWAAVDARVGDAVNEIEEEVGGLQPKKSSVTGAIDQMKLEIDERETEFGSTLHDAVGRGEGKVEESLGFCSESCSASVDKIAQVLSSDAGALLTESCGDVGAVLSRLSEAFGEGGGDFSESIGDAVNSIEEVIDMVEQIEPILEAIQKTL